MSAVEEETKVVPEVVAVVEENESSKRQKPNGPTAKFGYTILYVEDVEKTMLFYETAFGIQRGHLTEDKAYGDLITGSTKLGFVEQKFAAGMGGSFEEVSFSKPPPAFELVFVADDVDALLAHAISSGGTLVKKPETKPWGQVVAYIKDINGFLVELCTPMDH